MSGNKKGKKGMDGVRTAENMVEPDVDYKARCAAMAADWKKLNEFLNKTAAAHRWCSEYEERLALYNGQFSTLQLIGRRDGERGTREDPYYRRMLEEQQGLWQAPERPSDIYTEMHGYIQAIPVNYPPGVRYERQPCSCASCRRRQEREMMR